ncbi:hypothetical protein CRUP_002025 [Coryphaenoides rupestris]|nr:hypothetical protein CRUP_002025 [Coryphaenoides rupestris]
MSPAQLRTWVVLGVVGETPPERAGLFTAPLRSAPFYSALAIHPHDPAKPHLLFRMKMRDQRTQALWFLVAATALSPCTSGQSDYAPYFYDNGPSSTHGNMALFSISEDTPVGTHVYTLNGTDPEDDPVRYELAFEKGSREYFRAETKSGNVTLVQELDREKQAEISALVSITDGRNKVVETVRIFVTDANDEQPEFRNLPFIIDVPEDTAPGSSIYKVQAFTIDGHSGVLRIRANETLDYETTPAHFVTVVAKDGGGKYKGVHQVMSSTATITVNVVDAQDTPPSFVGTPYFGYIYEVSLPKYLQCLPKMEIKAIRTLFIILLSTASEVGESQEPMDYDITTVTVRVVDLNNHPPTFYGEVGPQNRFEVTMFEHPPAGEILRGFKITVNDSDQGANAKFKLRLVGPGRVLRVVPQTVLNEAQVTIIVEDTSGIDYEKGATLSFKAIDPDSGPWGEVKYTIYGTGSDLFSINYSSGVISTQPWASLDAEARSKYNFYVKAEDGEGEYSLAEVFVTVLDLNDHPPEFQQTWVEKTMIIGTPVRIEAVDEDAESPNNVIEYSIMKAEPDNNIFVIDGETGDIKLRPYIKSLEIIHNITKQQDCTWSLVVEARDRGSPSFSTTAVLNIDITEATPLMAALLRKSKGRPMKVLGMVTGIISILVGATVFFSTAMYLRNSKSNRVTPARRVIKRRPRHPEHPWPFPMPLFKDGGPPVAGKFLADDPEEGRVTAGTGSRTRPPPPCLPPPPPLSAFGVRTGERPRAGLPTISGALASQGSKKKSRSTRLREGALSSALVTELKLKLEQKINESNQGYC